MHYSLIHANFNLQIYVMFNNILDAFEKLRNATIGFVMSVRMEHLGSHTTFTFLSASIPEKKN